MPKVRLSPYPYELTEKDEPPRQRDASSLRPLATDVGPQGPMGSRGRWPVFFVGLVLGAVSAISVTAWVARTHRWQLGGAPEVHASAAAAPVEACPSAIPQPLVRPPTRAANASGAFAPPAGDVKCAVDGVAKGKKTKKKHHSVRSAAGVPEPSAEPPGPPLEEQAETELSNWLK